MISSPNSLISLKNKRIIKLLKKYEEALQDEKSKPQEVESKWQNLISARKKWMETFDEDLSSREFKHYLLDEIDASAGGGGFLLPEYVEKGLKNVEAVEYVDYNNHLVSEDLLEAIQRYVVEEGILSEKVSLCKDIYDDSQQQDLHVLAGLGTNQLFSLMMPGLIKNPGDVILVTDPTYGLLLSPIDTAGGKVATCPLLKENGYKPTAKQLEEIIQAKLNEIIKSYQEETLEKIQLCEQLFKDTTQKAAFKKIKKNLIGKSGLFLNELDNIADDFNELLLQAKLFADRPSLAKPFLLNPCPRIRGFFNINPHTPLGTILEQDEINRIAQVLKKYDIYVIDDLTHKDILLGSKIPGNFANSVMKDKTISLLSFSKGFCVAGLRAGFMIGPQEILRVAAKGLFESVCMLPTHTLKTMELICKMPKVKRDQYLEENNQHYIFRKNLLKAIIYGIDSIEPKLQAKAILNKCSQFKLQKKVKQNMLTGIPGLKLVAEPEGAYFALLDLSEFKGKYLGNVQLNSSMDFRNAFKYLSDLEVVPGELNFSFDNPSVRFSLCLTPKEIFEGMLRIKGILGLMTLSPSLTISKQPTVKNLTAKKTHSMEPSSTESETELVRKFDQTFLNLKKPSSSISRPGCSKSTQKIGTRLRKGKRIDYVQLSKGSNLD